MTVLAVDETLNNPVFDKLVKEHYKKYCVIWDLDGVLANCDHRLHYIVADRSNPDWESFHKYTMEDTPIESGRILFWALDMLGISQFICTARPESNREMTEAWLQKYEIRPVEKLFMRKPNDFRSGHEVKLDMLKTIWEMGYEVLMAFDDHPEIVNMYRMSSVPCYAADPRHWHENTVQQIAANFIKKVQQ